MMRVNLLPPEILERRQAEERLRWVIFAGIGVAVLLAGVFGFGAYRLSVKEAELASAQQEVQSVNVQAAQLAIFEERISELETRRVTAAAALENRVNWARLFEEFSLILPADIWLQTLSSDEKGGLQMSGYALDSSSEDSDLGHKAMARFLVRLADLKQLNNVWTNSSTKSVLEEQPVVQFTASASIVATGSDTP